MSHDDDAFAQTLSRLATQVAPAITVDTSRVVPTARRRRERRRSLVTASFGVALLAGAGIAQAPAWTTGPASGPAVVAQEDTSTAPAIAPFAVGLDETPVPVTTDDAASVAADDDGGLLPLPVVGALGAAGVAALATGAWFRVRSRRHTA